MPFTIVLSSTKSRHIQESCPPFHENDRGWMKEEIVRAYKLSCSFRRPRIVSPAPQRPSTPAEEHNASDHDSSSAEDEQILSASRRENPLRRLCGSSKKMRTSSLHKRKQDPPPPYPEIRNPSSEIIGHNNPVYELGLRDPGELHGSSLFVASPVELSGDSSVVLAGMPESVSEYTGHVDVPMISDPVSRADSPVSPLGIDMNTPPECMWLRGRMFGGHADATHIDDLIEISGNLDSEMGGIDERLYGVLQTTSHIVCSEGTPPTLIPATPLAAELPVALPSQPATGSSRSPWASPNRCIRCGLYCQLLSKATEVQGRFRDIVVALLPKELRTPDAWLALGFRSFLCLHQGDREAQAGVTPWGALVLTQWCLVALLLVVRTMLDLQYPDSIVPGADILCLEAQRLAAGLDGWARGAIAQLISFEHGGTQAAAVQDLDSFPSMPDVIHHGWEWFVSKLSDHGSEEGAFDSRSAQFHPAIDGLICALPLGNFTGPDNFIDRTFLSFLLPAMVMGASCGSLGSNEMVIDHFDLNKLVERVPGALADPSAAKLVEVLEPCQVTLQHSAPLVWESLQILCEIFGSSPSPRVPFSRPETVPREVFGWTGGSACSTPETTFCDMFGSPGEVYEQVSSPITPPSESASGTPFLAASEPTDLKCPICGHVPLVSGIKNYRVGNMTRHLKTHVPSAERQKHWCECGKSFGRSDNLRKHRKRCAVFRIELED